MFLPFACLRSCGASVGIRSSFFFSFVHCSVAFFMYANFQKSRAKMRFWLGPYTHRHRHVPRKAPEPKYSAERKQLKEMVRQPYRNTPKPRSVQRSLMSLYFLGLPERAVAHFSVLLLSFKSLFHGKITSFVFLLFSANSVPRPFFFFALPRLEPHPF